MLTALAGVVWTLLVGAVGAAIGYRIGHRHGWTDAGQTGYETLVDGGWLRGGGRRGE